MHPRSRLARRRGAAALALLMLAALTPPDAAAAPPPSCCFTKGIEGYASYDPQDTCDPTVKPGTDKLRDLLLATYPQSRDLGIVRACNVGSTSEHKEGRAFDWGVRVNVANEKAAADEFLAWLLKDTSEGNDAMARRMGIMYMIWNGKIWGSYRASDGWRTYTGSNPHTDHVHFSLSWDGAMGRTSYWCCRTNPGPSDTTPPDTDASLSGTAGSNGWWRSAVTVRLSASDNSGGSGVASTHYRVDGGAWKTYGGPFAVGGEGTHDVDYYSKDKDGNVEPQEQVLFKIDTVAPSTGRSLAGTQGNAGWWRSAVTVTLSPADATSGVASTEVNRGAGLQGYAGPFAVGGDGQHLLSYRSHDRAGNVEAWRSLELAIDSRPPVTTLGIAGPTFAKGGTLFVGAAARASLAASDALSGVAATSWTWRGGAAQAYRGAFAFPGPDGPGTLAWRSEDVAGNAEAWGTKAVHLDTAPPTLAVEAPADGSVVLSLEPTRIVAQASDAGVGVARVEFLVDGALRHVAAAAPYAWDWMAGDEWLGDHALVVRAVDHLGHASTDTRTLTTVPTTPAGAMATADHTAAEAQAALADPQGTAHGALAAVQGLAGGGVPALEPPALPSPGLPSGPPAAPPALPVVGVVAEADPGGGAYEIGLLVDGQFVGVALDL